MPEPLDRAVMSESRDQALDAVLRRIAERFEDRSGEQGRVRAEIVGSWRRSMGAGLSPDQFDVPYEAAVDRSALWRAAEPVLARMSADLEGTRTGLVLADQHGRIIDSRAPDPEIRRLLERIELAPGFLYAEEAVGTNAIGTALETSEPAVVRGIEHFARALVQVACSAVPIRDPASHRVLGIIDLTSAAADASGLMVPLAKRAAWEIEQRLVDRTSDLDRVLQAHFLRARRSTHSPIAIVSAQRMLVNTPAARLLREEDRAVLWDHVADASRTDVEIPLADGRTIVATTESIVDGGRRIGALVRFGKDSHADTAKGRRAEHGPRPEGGLASLSPTERVVATLVAEGLTNREAAVRLVLSPHTIDFHLRHIFGKLDVSSRVELTRVVLHDSRADGAFGRG